MYFLNRVSSKEIYNLLSSQKQYLTTIRRGITCKKIPCYILTQLAGDVLLKKLKHLEVLLKFLNSPKCDKLQNLNWPMQISFHELLNHIHRLR